MKTIELEMDNFQSPEDLVRFMENHDLKKGDTLRVTTDEEKKAVVVMAVLMLIILAIYYYFLDKSGKERRADGEKILDTLFKGKTVEEIEESALLEYGIKIELEQRESDEERNDWFKLSAQTLSKAYSNDEPEYTEGDVQEPNTEYKAWKGK